MIGKPEWFRRRKYGGWGISPKTWQGWAYVFFIILPFIGIQSLPFWDNTTRIFLTLAWVGFLLFDISHIMLTLNRDEREQKIEAIAERNAAWAMMLVLVLALVYQSISSALNQEVYVDPFLLATLLAGALTKTVSNFILERRRV